MAYTEFYMQTTGDDLNAGSTTGDSAAYTSTSGNWDGTSVFTPTDGATTSASVNVGDWVSIYATGATSAVYVAQVTAVGAGANGTITLSTTLKYGTAPASNSGSRNAKAGGAWASLAVVTSLFTSQTVASSTRVNVKAGTYANTTTTRAFAAAGSVTAALSWRGYKTTIGDQVSNFNAVAGTDIPLFTFTTGQVTSAGTKQKFRSLAVSSQCTTINGAWSNSGANNEFSHVRIDNTAANSASRALTGSGVNSIYSSCLFKATSTATTVIRASAGALFTGCVLSGGANSFDDTSTNNIYVHRCIFDNPGSDAVSMGTSNQVASFQDCSFYVPVGHGINVSSTGIAYVANCYFEGASQSGKAAVANTTGTDTDLIKVVGCGYYGWLNNTSGITESSEILSAGTLGAAAFNAPGSQDFSLKTAAWNLGYPGQFEGTATYRSYGDLGAVRHQDPGGSAFNPIGTQIIRGTR